MCATIVRVQKLRDQGDARAPQMARLADVYAHDARRLIDRHFHELWANDDDLKRKAGHELLDGAFTFVEESGVGAPQAAPGQLETAAK